jgi:hypothetical protein
MRSCGPPLLPLANDPARTLRTIEMSMDHVAALDGPNFLSTVMVDFILQTAFKEDRPSGGRPIDSPLFNAVYARKSFSSEPSHSYLTYNFTLRTMINLPDSTCDI